MDYSKDIITMDNEFTKLKAEIISKLSNAVTYEDYEVISKVTGYKLSSIVRDVTRFKNDASNKKFTSVKHAQDSINSINLAISQLWEMIK